MSEVPPTRMNQQVFKGKKKAAESGHKLLKKKADALKVRYCCSRNAYKHVHGKKKLIDKNWFDIQQKFKMSRFHGI
jgi:vacuolar-type H+-ATPase subunit D/Vma8